MLSDCDRADSFELQVYGDFLFLDGITEGQNVMKKDGYLLLVDWRLLCSLSSLHSHPTMPFIIRHWFEPSNIHKRLELVYAF